MKYKKLSSSHNKKTPTQFSCVSAINSFISSYVGKAAFAVCVIESFKPPLLQVGVRKSFPVYPHAQMGQGTPFQLRCKTPCYSIKVKT